MVVVKVQMLDPVVLVVVRHIVQQQQDPQRVLLVGLQIQYHQQMVGEILVELELILFHPE